MVASSFRRQKGNQEKKRIDMVEIKRLDSIIDSLLLDVSHPRIFLKVDTQGCDMEVIRGAEGCIDIIVGLQSEISVTPKYEHMPHYLTSLEYYESLGFSLMDLCIVYRTMKYQSILQYDCVIARLN